MKAWLVERFGGADAMQWRAFGSRLLLRIPPLTHFSAA